MTTRTCNSVQRTIDGSGRQAIDFDCGGIGGIYSVTYATTNWEAVANIKETRQVIPLLSSRLCQKDKLAIIVVNG